MCWEASYQVHTVFKLLKTLHFCKRPNKCLSCIESVIRIQVLSLTLRILQKKTVRWFSWIIVTIIRKANSGLSDRVDKSLTKTATNVPIWSGQVKSPVSRFSSINVTIHGTRYGSLRTNKLGTQRLGFYSTLEKGIRILEHR